jgi:hypothetical protein
VKYRVIALFGIAFVSVVGAGGCFNPNIRNGGFACNGTQDGQCPTGFTCVNGLCTNNPGAVVNNPPRDLAMSLAVDMAMTTMNVDMAHTMMSSDLAMSTPPDMTKLPPPPDMAKSACAHDYCATGVALNASCDPCVNAICAADSYCCRKQWDSICVDQVLSYCDLSQQCP